MKVIINTDDLGLTYGFTEAIKDSYQNGIASSTCIRPNGKAYPYAVKLLKGPLKNIGLGIHLNLTDGPVSQPLLADKYSNSKYNFHQLFFALLKDPEPLIQAIKDEFESQFVKVQRDNLQIDHINSQEHIHMIPQIFEIVCQLANKYNIKYIRLVKEPFYLTSQLSIDLKPLYNTNLLKFLLLNYFSVKNQNLLKKYRLKTTDAFFSILHTNFMNSKVIEKVLQYSQKHNLETIEIAAHPAYSNDLRDKIYTSDMIRDYVNSTARVNETATFTNPQTGRLVNEFNIQKTTFKKLS